MLSSLHNLLDQTVVTGIIKANFPSRVCLMVASDLESRIVLDEGGGESLSPKGDMIIKHVMEVC